jgi:hypothetical protein
MNTAGEASKNTLSDTKLAIKAGKKKLTETFHDITKVVMETPLVKTSMVHPVISVCVVVAMFVFFLIGCYIAVKG